MTIFPVRASVRSAGIGFASFNRLRLARVPESCRVPYPWTRKGEDMKDAAERRRLRKYQRAGLGWAGTVPDPALFWEPRLGKTIVPIRRWKADRVRGPILIVGPYACLGNWRRELILEGVPDKDIVFLTADTDRRAALKSGAMFKLMNKEGFRALPEVAGVRWEEMVADESTFLKAPPRFNWSEKHGKRPGMSKFFAEHFRDVKRRWILTGTPSPEGELDLYQQLAFLNPSILPFKTWYHFREALFEQIDRGTYDLTVDGREYLTKRLAKYCSYLSRNDVDMGVKVVKVRRMVRLPTGARKMYRTAQREFLLEYGDQVHAAVDHGVAAFAWLRRICGGFISNVATFKHKASELIELISGELSGESLVVWCSYRAELLHLSRMLTREGIKTFVVHGDVKPVKREAIFESFRRGARLVLLCEPTVAKYSQDFGHCDIMVYYSTPMGLEARQQSQDRFIRVAEKRTKYVIDLVTEDTIDEDIVTSLYIKETKSARIKRIVQRLQGKG